MIDRGLLKNRAKGFLRNHFWQAFAVCIIVSILTGEFGVTFKFDKDGFDDTKLFGMETQFEDLLQKKYYSIGSDDADFGYMLVSLRGSNNVLRVTLNATVLIILTAIVVAGLLWRIFISEVLIVGQARYFLDGFKGQGSFETLFSPYSRGEWIKLAGKMFVKNLYLFFWLLLFIIPGIIKSYAYRMVPYILAEDPTLSISEAIRRSNEMTNQIKFEMFILDLSFLGWYLLGLIPCGLGVLFVVPYHQATIGRLYESLSQDSITSSAFVKY